MKLEQTVTLEQSPIEVPDPSDLRVTRHVKAGPLRLLMWDTGMSDNLHKPIVGYAAWREQDEEPLFVGEDLAIPHIHAIDSDETVLSCLSFLTVPSVFEKPSDKQSDWLHSSECNELSNDVMYAEECVKEDMPNPLLEEIPHA